MKSTNKPVTVLPLKALAGACKGQMAIVREIWPDGIPIDAAAVDQAIQLDLDLDWAAKHVLTPQALSEYLRVREQASAEYERVKGQASAEYKRVREQAWAEYLRVREQALAEYLRVEGQALAEYLRVEGQALAEYERVCGLTIIRLLVSKKE